MHVISHARPGRHRGSAQVEAIGGHDVSQALHRAPRELHQAQQLRVVQIVEPSHVPVGATIT